MQFVLAEIWWVLEGCLWGTRLPAFPNVSCVYIGFFFLHCHNYVRVGCDGFPNPPDTLLQVKLGKRYG